MRACDRVAARADGQTGSCRTGIPRRRVGGPGRVDAAIGLAILLTKQRHDSEAVRVLERAKGAEPRNPGLLAALGSAYLRVSNAKLALAYLELAAALSPTPENVNALKRARRAHRSSAPRSADVGTGS